MGGRAFRWTLVVVCAVWGFFSYLVLWGYTPIVVTERFVVSVPGLLLLLPARAVLESIHLIEQRVVHHPFDFSNTNGWIGYAAALAGALIGWLAWLVLSVPARLGRRSREREPEPTPGGNVAHAEDTPATEPAP
jgi:membrane associated rhomboid family serine protease